MSARSTAARHLIEQGYVAVEGALDPDFCEEVVANGFERLGVDPANPETWPVGGHNMPASRVFPIDDVAPTAAAVLDELVGGRDNVRFGDIPDNLIFNFPDATPPWQPEDWQAAGAGYHKDGDWFRHFLDSPEQGLLGIVFWRDVDPDQGPTVVAFDSIGPVARQLAAHPEGLAPQEIPYREILEQCRSFGPLTGRQGTIVWAHPFLVHSRSVNTSTRPRVISNTAVMLRSPLCFDRPDRRYTPIERVILDALGVDSLSFAPTRPRQRIESERERRWRQETEASSS